MRYKSEIQLDEAQIRQILQEHFANKGHNVEKVELRTESRTQGYGDGEFSVHYTTGKVTVCIEDDK